MPTIVLNRSFENPASVQGYAAFWVPAFNAAQEAFGLFSITGADPVNPDTWKYAEDVESKWFIPGGVVHDSTDVIFAVLLLSLPLTSANEIGEFVYLLQVFYRLHLQNVPMHKEEDFAHTIAVDPLSADIDILAAYLNTFIPFFNAHIQYLNAHYQVDTKSIFYTSPLVIPTSLPALIAYAAAVRLKVAEHFNYTSLARSNEASYFTLPVLSGVDYAEFNDNLDSAEAFARNWAINDLYSLVDQAIMVTVDSLTAYWSKHHIEFLSIFEYVGSAFSAEESFENSWYLPALNEDLALPNDLFLTRYYTANGDQWALTGSTSELGLLETFEAGWLRNDESLAKYYSIPAGWVLSDIEPCGFVLHELANVDYTQFGYPVDIAPVLIAPKGSPYIYAEVTKAITNPARLGIRLEYESCAPAALQLTFWFDDTRHAVGSKVYMGVPGADPWQPEDFTYNFMTDGACHVSAVNAIYGGPTGAISFKGWKYAAESFEEDWTLMLE